MSVNVQRKLEFQVRKSTKNSCSEEKTQSTRATRRSVRNSKKEQETCANSLDSPPRKRHSDEEDSENQPVPVFHTPSKKSKVKDDLALPQRLEETPTRGSLAKLLAVARLSDSDSQNDDKHSGKDNGLLSPKKSDVGSPVKGLPSPAKGSYSLTSAGVQLRCPLSPIKLASNNIMNAAQSPVKTLLHGRPLLSSPQKSPRKSLVAALSPKKSPSLKISRPNCEAYHQAKQVFHTAKPERLIGRDTEMTEIRSFLKGHMTKKTAGSLYISGAPGTGKTAVLTHIIDELKGSHSCKSVYLNCMTLDNSATVFGKLYTDITGKNMPTAKERLRAVEKVLTSDGPSVVLILDEIDQLDSKNQEVLYTIFEWPSLPKSRLILVGIANALDLTDRVLPRLQARPNCCPKLLNFAPYTKEQISAILKDRIKDLDEDLMDAVAIQFCARKISAVAGDMRKALDVCRRAVEMVETSVRSQAVLSPPPANGSKSPRKLSPPKVPQKIGVAHINNVLSMVYGSGAAAQQQETIPLQQKLVVCSLLLLLKQGKVKEVTTGKLHDVYCKICKNRQMAAVDQSEFQGAITLLEARGMIGVKKGKETRLNKIALKLDEKELEHTLQDKVLVSTILQEGMPK
ncbi:cell division control protein 6 homolog [Dreissena polymorpha]|nr:cell division control protein 6 homolog [Dreissena polymorpha]